MKHLATLGLGFTAYIRVLVLHVVYCRGDTRRIQDEIGPGMDLEMWELHVLCCSSIISFIIINAAYQATHQPGSHQCRSIQAQAHVKYALSHIPANDLHFGWLYGHLI